MNMNMKSFEHPRAANRHFSKKGVSVLVTGVAALILFPLCAVVIAADAALKNF